MGVFRVHIVRVRLAGLTALTPMRIMTRTMRSPRRTSRRRRSPSTSLRMSLRKLKSSEISIFLLETNLFVQKRVFTSHMKTEDCIKAHAGSVVEPIGQPMKDHKPIFEFIIFIKYVQRVQNIRAE